MIAILYVSSRTVETGARDSSAMGAVMEYPLSGYTGIFTMPERKFVEYDPNATTNISA